MFISIIFLFLFILGCAGSSLPHGLSPAAASGGYAIVACTGFSLQSLGPRARGLLGSCGSMALRARDDVAEDCLLTPGLEHGLSSHGTRASLPCSDLPSPGIEPMSPALATRLLTTGPLGKPQDSVISSPFSVNPKVF